VVLVLAASMASCGVQGVAEQHHRLLPQLYIPWYDCIQPTSTHTHSIRCIMHHDGVQHVLTLALRRP
jgi:hypothetical protein